MPTPRSTFVVSVLIVFLLVVGLAPSLCAAQQKSQMPLTQANNTTDLRVMAKTIATGNVENYGPADLRYRLWHSGIIVPGKPNTILVHGAVIPPGQVRERPNYCFRQLGPLLRDELYGQHNVWDFEYANTPSPLSGELCFNYGDLKTYGEELKDAIHRVRELNPGSDVNIVAHSMGGLIARYAAQDGAVDKIVTLDTGHFGFEIAGFADVFVKNLPVDIQDNVRCTDQTAPGSEFLYTLDKDFKLCKVKLLSLAAGEPIGGVTVVRWTSSSLGQISGDGSIRYHPVCTPFVIVNNVDHLSIAEINDESHPAFTPIAQFLNAGRVTRPTSHPSGDQYFVVVLSKQPQLGYPRLSIPTCQIPCRINDASTGYHAVVFKVLNVRASQDVQIEYAPNQYVVGRLTRGQSTIRIDVIHN
jgi:pimeloyl-ACP methyl ester carboxylesterase